MVPRCGARRRGEKGERVETEEERGVRERERDRERERERERGHQIDERN